MVKNNLIRCSVYLIILSFLFLSHKTNAIYLDKTTYVLDEFGSVPIVTTSPATDGVLVLYKIGTELPILSFDNYFEGEDLNTSRLIPGQYSIVELSPSAGDEWYCNIPEQELIYDTCKTLSGFVNEFIFKIDLGSYDYAVGGSSNLLGGFYSYVPIVTIDSPYNGIFSTKVPITYSAIDHNDGHGSEESKTSGLVENPVSIYYSNKFISQNQSFIPENDKILITKNLPSSGTYFWENNLLSEEEFYRVIVSAVDNSGQIGQSVSDYFRVDLTKPNFIVTTNPSFVINDGDVNIKISSSEDLSDIPEVYVTQNGSSRVKIKMTGSHRDFSGIYSVVSGFDGTAKIEVRGTDLAGNMGDLIIGGGTFSVGINPPKKPIIISHNDNDNVTSQNIKLIGTSRDDTEIFVTVNGVDTYNTKPDKNGNFEFNNIYLKKNIKNGLNVLNIVSKDFTGATSEALVLHLFFNISPEISIIKPYKDDVLSGTSILSIKDVDDNNDLLYFTYQITHIPTPVESDWKTIVNAPNDSIYFDTTKFIDGNYLLRVLADDGMNKAISNILPVRIRNEQSFFIRFYDGVNTIVNQKNATIRGMVYAEKNIYPTPVIKSLEYSFDNGKTWVSVSAQDGLFDSPEERFEVSIKNLKDGINDILWRTVDSRNLQVKSNQPIIVDRVLPKPPVVFFPENESIITNSSNETREKGKFIFTLKGNSEPNSTVNITINDQKFISKASFDGSFKIENISLAKRGKYKVQTFAVDDASNKSPVVEYSFLYNNPPSVVFTNPSDGRGVNGKTTITWLSSDKDGDKILNKKLSYRKVGESLVTIANDISTNKFVWDASKLSEGNNYELVLEVSDGLSTTITRTYFSVDRSIPTLSDFKVKKIIYKKGDIFDATGVAKDDKSGILFVEYKFLSSSLKSSENNESWYKAYIKNGVSNKNVSFVINNPLSLSDGEYTVYVRAVDVVGNLSLEKNINFIVDNNPPRVGSFEIFNSGLKILPQNGIWFMGMDSYLTIKISLEEDTKNAYLMNGDDRISLIKDSSSGLWVGNFYITKAGDNILKIFTEDKIGNTLKDNALVVLTSVDNNVKPSSSKLKWWIRLINMLK